MEKVFGMTVMKFLVVTTYNNKLYKEYMVVGLKDL